MNGLRCICKALAALNIESCCAPSSRSSSRTGRRSGPVKARTATESHTSAMVTSRYTESKSKQGCRKRCCEKNPQTEVTPKLLPVVVGAKKCLNDCCDDDAQNTATMAKSPGTNTCVDLERGPPSLEHVVLGVSGMTCTGCEKKLDRVLTALEQAANVKSSLVTSRAEFDIDLSIASVAETIRYVQNATGFDCELITYRGAELDLRLDRLPNTPIKGVTGSEATKEDVRVFYDATMIGARELVKALGDPELAPPKPDSSISTGARHVRNLAITTAASIALTIPILILAYAPLPKHEIRYGAISLALATLIQFGIAGPFYIAAFKSLFFSQMVELEFLIVLSTSAAYIFSVISYAFLIKGHPLSTGEFFETSSLLVSLIMVGRFLSAFARQQAIRSVSVRSLQPITANIVEPEKATIDSRLLQYSDIFEVVPEASVVTDGTITAGTSEVNESMVTGEAVPVQKNPGSRVVAGSINGSGKLTVRLNRLPHENTVSTIASMVDQAKLSKPKVQDIADRVAGWFIPIIVAISILTFAVWIGIGIRSKTAGDAAIQAITYAIATMIVSCPCAIGLAVPMVIVIIGGVAAKRGIVFKEAHAIEVAHRTTHVIFDKTGTLTEGRFSVVREHMYTANTPSVVLGLVEGIKHPVSLGVAKHLKAQGIRPARVESVRTIVGKGIEGTHNGEAVMGGNPRWVGLEGDTDVQSLRGTVFCVVLNGEKVAVFELQDSLRSDAKAAVDELSRRGISVSIVSGDDEGPVQAAASQLGISEYHARCSPEAKKDHLERLPQRVTIFCGDGTNDAVALAQATIGIHFEEGSEVAQNSADVVLTRPSLMAIVGVIDLSRTAYQRIVFNFVWSGVYNLFAILLAAGAFVRARIPPQYAGLGEIVSVLPVVLAAVQLRWIKAGRSRQ